MSSTDVVIGMGTRNQSMEYSTSLN